MAGVKAARAGGGLALLAAALAISACSTGPARLSPTGEGTASPHPVEGYDWFLNTEGAAAQLVYGVEASDDVRLSLACDRPDGKLEVAAHAPSGGPAEIHLESGGETERLPAKAEDMEVSDGDWLTAAARTSDPVFRRFRQVGWIALWQQDQRHALAPQPGSVGRIEQFFSRCG